MSVLKRGKRKFSELRLVSNLAKNGEQSFVLSSYKTSQRTNFSGGDAPGGNTRTHPEHDG